jgi:hypothetical protein
MKSLLSIEKSIQKLREQNKRVEIPAFLGDLSGVVKADDNNSVYVVLFNGEVQVVRNDKLPPIPRLPVIIGNDKKDSTMRVLRMREAFSDPPYVNIPAHADKTHQWPQVDTLWVKPEQFLSGIAIPSTGMIVEFVGFVYYLSGWHLLNTQSIDLTAYIPADGANYVLVQADVDKVISFVEGTTKASREVLEYADIPIPNVGQKPLFAVKMYKGQTHIIKAKSTSDIVDLRFAGFASGGEASVIDWDDILNVPLVFPPDGSTNPTKWLKSAPPTVDDDITTGYAKSDIWIDQSNGDAYICIDNADGAADWLRVGSGSGDYSFAVDGRLAVATNVPNAFIVTKDVEITACYIYCKTPGTASSTIVDVNKNGTTIYTTQANRPTLAYNDANGWASSIPDILTFAAGDVITLDIDAIATRAEDLVVALSVKGAGGGGIGLGLTVTDGVTTVDNVGQITVEGSISLVDDGGGQITISAPINDYILLTDEKANNTQGGTFTSGSYQTRDITTIASDVGGHCSISSNQITLAAGTYICSISAPAYYVEIHKAVLYNISDSAIELIGTAEVADNSSATGVVTRSFIKGQFTIASTKIFEVQHRCNVTKATTGFGVASNFGEVEIYTTVEFWKVA